MEGKEEVEWKEGKKKRRKVGWELKGHCINISVCRGQREGVERFKKRKKV